MQIAGFKVSKIIQRGAIILMLMAYAVTALAAKPTGETAGNNLSFPVIWTEGVAKVLPGDPATTRLQGAWWYWWGIDANDVPLSCAPDPDDMNLCNDGISGSTGSEPGFGAIRAYLQKDPNNLWQAESADGSAAPVNVDWIDWGDNLESVDWYTTSQVRVEVVLFQDLLAPMTEYGMRHVSGWGIDEVHGVAASGDPPIAEVVQYDDVLTPKATLYSNCARLTIQKLLFDRLETEKLAELVWDPQQGWTGLDLVHPPIFNDAVYTINDGPGYFNAETNVKGRVIYGYTWNVRKLNDKIVNQGLADGDYRITFSLDESCGTTSLNTYFVEPAEGGDPGTQIVVPLETEEVIVTAEGGETDSNGAVAKLDYENNLTYIDVRIHNRSSGGGGGSRK